MHSRVKISHAEARRGGRKRRKVETSKRRNLRADRKPRGRGCIHVGACSLRSACAPWGWYLIHNEGFSLRSGSHLLASARTALCALARTCSPVLTPGARTG